MMDATVDDYVDIDSDKQVQSVKTAQKQQQQLKQPIEPAKSSPAGAAHQVAKVGVKRKKTDVPSGKFYAGDLDSLVDDFTNTFDILSPSNQSAAKARHPHMPERFR